MGVRRGEADLLLVRDGVPPLFLEFVKSYAGRQTDSQREFQALAGRSGCSYALARSLDEALELLWSSGFLGRRLT
jgi:hypothetical protein